MNEAHVKIFTKEKRNLYRTPRGPHLTLKTTGMTKQVNNHGGKKKDVGGRA